LLGTWWAGVQVVLVVGNEGQKFIGWSVRFTECIIKTAVRLRWW
jgi:hypothetical protein